MDYLVQFYPLAAPFLYNPVEFLLPSWELPKTGLKRRSAILITLTAWTRCPGFQSVSALLVSVTPLFDLSRVVSDEGQVSSLSSTGISLWLACQIACHSLGSVCLCLVSVFDSPVEGWDAVVGDPSYPAPFCHSLVWFLDTPVSGSDAPMSF